VDELDLPSEWEDSVTVEQDGPAAERALEISDAVGDHDLPAADASSDENDEKCEETVEEVRFYLGHGMSDLASAAFARLQALTHDRALLAKLRAEIEAANQAPAAEEALQVPDSIEELAAEDIPSADLAAEEITVSLEDVPVREVTPSAFEAAPQLAASAPEVEAEVRVEQPRVLTEFVADLESSLGESFLPGAVEHAAEATKADEHRIPQRAKTIEPIPPAAPVKHRSAEAPALGELVADLEASLGDDFLKGAPVAEPEPVSAVAPQAPPPVARPAVAPPLSAPRAAAAAAGTTPASARTVAPPKPSAAYAMPVSAAKSSPFAEDAGVDLAEMFGELKQDLEADVASADEDPETHYSLGIAFREMGLLDEAIGELQKACQSVERGHAFPQIMQTYTWLAQCFLDKGVPEAAIRWYDKALSVPSIDGDTRVALHYELGAAYETSGDKPSALKHFTQVYGSNIDYRDVAERIKALKS